MTIGHLNCSIFLNDYFFNRLMLIFTHIFFKYGYTNSVSEVRELTCICACQEYILPTGTRHIAKCTICSTYVSLMQHLIKVRVTNTRPVADRVSSTILFTHKSAMGARICYCQLLIGQKTSKWFLGLQKHLLCLPTKTATK